MTNLYFILTSLKETDIRLMFLKRDHIVAIIILQLIDSWFEVCFHLESLWFLYQSCV